MGCNNIGHQYRLKGHSSSGLLFRHTSSSHTSCIPRPTCRIRAGLCVEGGPPHNDLMGDDGVAIDVPLLRHAVFTKVFWGCPQVWEVRQIYSKFRFDTRGSLGLKPASPLPGIRIVWHPKSVILTTMRLSTTQLVDFRRPWTWMLLEWRYDMPWGRFQAG